jgi:phage shock protein PspC (stress-responsive transcriptional regulator)
LAEKKIAGVCAGIARYLQMDVTLVRILVAIFTLYPPGMGLIFYIVCWIIMPRDAYIAIQKSTGEVANAAG